MTIWVAGCSFMVGDGLHHPTRDNSVALVADKYNIGVNNLAVQGSSNYGVYLQAKHAIEHAEEDDIVVISATSCVRTEWLYGDEDISQELTAKNIYYKKTQDIHPFVDDEDHNPILRMCQYWNDPEGKHIRNYMRESVDDAKIKHIIRFFMLYYPEAAKQDYDSSLFSAIHLMAKERNVKHMFISPSHVYEDMYVPRDIHLEMDWFTMAGEYPDELGTMHVNEEGHRIVSNNIEAIMKGQSWL